MVGMYTSSIKVRSNSIETSEYQTMSLSKIPFSTLSIETVLEMAKQSSDVLLRKYSEDPILSTPITDLNEPIRRTKLAIASSRKKELTEEINEADFKRDRAFVGFRKYVEAQQFKDWDRDAQKAATNVITIIERHGKNLYREGLTVQSALLTSMFEDFSREQTQEDLNAIDATEWLNHLKKLQEDFSSMIMRRDELEAKKDIPTKADAKAELVKKLSVLMSGLDFLTNTQSAKYGETGRLINEITERLTNSD